MAAADRVLVIGGSRGTGLLIARLLHQHGDRVRVLARDPTAAAARLGPGIEVVAGDLTKPESLPPAMTGVGHIVFTAGVHSGRIAPETLVKATDYDGVLNTLAAARRAGCRGRFLYLNSIGIATPSIAAGMLNLLKRNTLVWRRRVENDIRVSGLDYTIIRVGFLLSRPASERAVEVSQGALPLAPRHRIPRADVAEAFAAALRHPAASRATFEIVSGKHRGPTAWADALSRLQPDVAPGSSRRPVSVDG
jgi:uncharacterized protein YbjT (DUF2867 family)